MEKQIFEQRLQQVTVLTSLIEDLLRASSFENFVLNTWYKDIVVEKMTVDEIVRYTDLQDNDRQAKLTILLMGGNLSISYNPLEDEEFIDNGSYECINFNNVDGKKIYKQVEDIYCDESSKYKFQAYNDYKLIKLIHSYITLKSIEDYREQYEAEQNEDLDGDGGFYNWLNIDLDIKGMKKAIVDFAR